MPHTGPFTYVVKNPKMLAVLDGSGEEFKRIAIEEGDTDLTDPETYRMALLTLKRQLGDVTDADRAKIAAMEARGTILPRPGKPRRDRRKPF